MNTAAEMVAARVLLGDDGARFVHDLLAETTRRAERDGVNWRRRPRGPVAAALLQLTEAQLSASGHEFRAWPVAVSSSAQAPPGLLTTSEAAAVLGASPRTVVRMITRGELPARKVGRQWLISGDDARRIAARDGRHDAADAIHRRANRSGGRRRDPRGQDAALAAGLLADPAGNGRQDRRADADDADGADASRRDDRECVGS